MEPQIKDETATPQPQDGAARIAELEALVDERDETIRLLNEALSRALDELALLDEAA